jgi:hypothetical protein
MITLGRLETALVRWRNLSPRWDAWRETSEASSDVHVVAGRWELIASWLPPRKVRRALAWRRALQEARERKAVRAAQRNAEAEDQAQRRLAIARITTGRLFRVRPLVSVRRAVP